jgi:deoxycytidylate deaminase
MKLPNGVLDLAISQALKSPMSHMHGAVIWKKGKIIGAGYNYHLAAPTPTQRQISIHSEKDCLNGLHSNQIFNSSVLTVRVAKNGDMLNGQPCKGCKKLLKRKGIKKIYWFDSEAHLSVTYLN